MTVETGDLSIVKIKITLYKPPFFNICICVVAKNDRDIKCVTLVRKDRKFHRYTFL
jgi:hypothetical protein